MNRTVLAAAAAVCLMVLPSESAEAQPAKVVVEGGPKEMKEQVLALLRASTDLVPVPYIKGPEANINLQKKGGANVKCGDAKAFLPGPSAVELVAQFREWLPSPLAARRANRAARAEAWARGLQAFADGFNSGNSGSATPSSAFSPSTSSTKLLLFGGENNKTFLGCVNCSKFDTDSVLNPYGEYGSKFSSNSILNQFSQFGGKFGAYSPCNAYTLDPPVIVDAAGRFYGRLTISTTQTQAVTGELRAWITGVCAGQ